MNVIQERLGRLRELMAEKGMDAYLVVTADFHESEYVGEFFKCRKFLTGFTGSAGTAVVTMDEACLWTDGRYFVQAAAQLAGSGIRLMKMREEDVPTVQEYLAEKMPAGGCLGFDGRTVNAAEALALNEALEAKYVRFDGSGDLVGTIWQDRPPMSAEPVWALADCYAGENAAEKIRKLREKMAQARATVHILTSLDDIAWLLNIRGNDVLYNPVALAYVMVFEDRLLLFANEKILEEKAYPYLEQGEGFSGTVREYLQGLGVTVKPYEAVYEETGLLRGQRIMLERKMVNYAIYSRIDGSNQVIERMNPTSQAKAVKNPVEMENMRKAHIKDGVAMTRFIYWLKHNVGKVDMDEISVAEHLRELRLEQDGCLGCSFETISAYGAHAAMCHYSATEETNVKLEPKGMYLVDSGGQYYEGTTDITRTVVMGPVTDEEREHFTLVLISMLRLGAVKFLHGCRGISLDYVAREPFWSRGLDYNHGTGHGVGYLLNVHERPNSIRYRLVTDARENAELEEGMVTSDEPGLYIEGSHGIRTENLVMCVKDEKNAYGQFMRFEFLTFVPIDVDGIDRELMTDRDVELLNEYHQQVYEKISPYLPEEEARWLWQVTAEI